jgi:hypothetical protein
MQDKFDYFSKNKAQTFDPTSKKTTGWQNSLSLSNASYTGNIRHQRAVSETLGVQSPSVEPMSAGTSQRSSGYLPPVRSSRRESNLSSAW